MKVINIGEENTILNTFVAEMRDYIIQKDSLRFRTNLERVGEIFAYEISKKLEYSVKEVHTPLGIASISTIDRLCRSLQKIREGGLFRDSLRLLHHDRDYRQNFGPG